MPTYEYHCDTCDKNFDVVQSFSDDPLTECPTCGSPVRKVFGNVGIVFKGSGFYKTDSRSGGAKKAPSGDATPAPSSGSGDSGSNTDGGGSTSGGDSSSSKAETPSSPSAPATSGGDTKSSATSNSTP